MRFKSGSKPLTSRKSIELHHGRWRLAMLDPAGCGLSPCKASQDGGGGVHRWLWWLVKVDLRLIDQSMGLNKAHELWGSR
jgi:hypothetical protein